MPTGSIERINARKEEIINACERLYQTKSFKDITLKDIGNETSFSRTSIYNYFQTKEEIFLSLLKREYEIWRSDLQKIYEDNEIFSNSELAEVFAKTLTARTQLLKILSMNHYDLENNSDLEHLIDFKRSYGLAMNQVELLLVKFRPDMNEERRKEFLYLFFPFMFGMYPYTVVSDKQKEAMEKAQVNYVYNSLYDFIYKATKRMLEN